MHDLALVGFIVALIALGTQRPFLFVLGYAYVDIVSPQRLSYYLLNAVPVSLIFFVLAVGGFLAVDDKTGTRLSGRQAILILLLLWCGYTTFTADFPVGRAREMGLGVEGAGVRDLPAVHAAHAAAARGAAAVHGALGLVDHRRRRDQDAARRRRLRHAQPRASATIRGCTRARRSRPSRSRSSRPSSISPDMARSSRAAGWCGSTASRWCCLPADPDRHRDAHRADLHRPGRGDGAARFEAAHPLHGAMAVALAIAIPLLPQPIPRGCTPSRAIRPTNRPRRGSRCGAGRGTMCRIIPPAAASRPICRTITLHLTDNHGEALGANSVEYDKARAYHSAYFEMLGEQGFAGFGLWALLHLTGLFRLELLRRRFRRGRPRASNGSRRSRPRSSTATSSIWSARCSSRSPSSRSSTC